MYATELNTGFPPPAQLKMGIVYSIAHASSNVHAWVSASFVKNCPLVTVYHALCGEPKSVTGRHIRGGGGAGEYRMNVQSAKYFQTTN